MTDGFGGPVPGATVEAVSSSLQGTRSGLSGADGTYRLPALPPGSYRVTVRLSSLRTSERIATVPLGGTATVDFMVQLASAEQVVVSGAAPAVDTTSTTGGTSYTSSIVAKLPTARNYADIVRANPAVSTDQGETQGRGLALTIYGATSAENQWLIDGVNTTSVQKGIQGKAINNEFVQEVEVKSGGYPAEYGGALGGVVNVVTKSGGNEFHGDGFVYYDSSTTSARQVFNSEDAVAAEMRMADFATTDFGADLGGYLVKDRLWFFGAYDRVVLDGNLSRIVASELVSTSDRFPLNGTDNLYSGKLTWNVSNATSVVATVFADPSSSSGASGVDPRQDQRLGRFESTAIVNPDPATWSSSRQVGGVDYGLRATQLLSSWGLVALQASHHQDKNSLTASDTIRRIDLRCPESQPSGSVDNPCQVPSIPNLVTGGFGVVDGPLDNNISHRDQLRGDASFYLGPHEVKAGGGYAYGSSDATYTVSGGQEVTLFNQYGTPYYMHLVPVRSLSDLTPVSGVNLRARSREYGAYVQDSWRAAAGLTVNVGLRWDFEQLIDSQGVEAFSLGNEWQPRLGVVWDPWNDGRTKLQAFAGRFYYSLPTSGTGQAFHDYTVVSIFNYDPLSLVPAVVHGHDPVECQYGCGGINGSQDPLDLVDRNLRGTYQDEFSIGAERMLDPTLTVGVKATYRRLGNAVEDRCDFGEMVAGTSYTQCAIINPGSGEKYARGDAPVCEGYSDVGADVCTPTGPATPRARRTYRGIEITARKAIGDRLWAQASYVYSSLMGNYDGGVNETFQNTTPGLNQDFDWPQLWHNAYGILFLDRPSHFRFDGYWTAPINLSVGLQAYVASGAPLDRLGYFQGVPSVYLDPRGSTGRLPTQWEANLTLSYPLNVGPATVTLQAYVFNVFNNQIATSRNDDWTVSPPAGYPDSVYDPNVASDNPLYGKNTSRQPPRSFRAAVRVSF